MPFREENTIRESNYNNYIQLQCVLLRNMILQYETSLQISPFPHSDMASISPYWGISYRVQRWLRIATVSARDGSVCVRVRFDRPLYHLRLAITLMLII